MKCVLTTVVLVATIQYTVSGFLRKGLCHRRHVFNNKLMSTYLVERYEYVSSVTWCAVLCLTEPKCGSFFYSKMEKFCQLHSVLFITPADATDYPGTWYFEMTQEWCPDKDGFVLHRSPTLCYKIHMETQTYDQAKITCSAEGATLMKVKDEYISYHMFEFLRASSDVRFTHFLIGADDNLVSGQYRWVDGDMATWTNWADGEPSHVSERCLAMAWFYYFKWNDVPCSHAMSFICQIDAP